MKFQKYDLEKMLVVEKSQGFSNDHHKTKNIVLGTLERLGIKYDITNDESIKQVDMNKYETILTLGGDGTFVNAVKYVDRQNVIGVNSNPNTSVGFLTKFDKSNVEEFLVRYEKKKFEVEKFYRLGVKINDEEYSQRAVNEILVGEIDIRHMSHLDINVNNKSAYVRGNAVLFAAKQGSYAFYKSSGGTPFDINAVGYSLVLPYSIEGNLEKSEVCDINTKIVVLPRRNSCKVVFDCDDNRTFIVNEKDKIEVFVDTKKPLSIVK